MMIARLLKAAQRAVQGEDLVYVELTFHQLSIKASEMEKAMMSMEGSTDPQNKAKLQDAEASLGELERKRQWMRTKGSEKPQHKENIP
jgi:hypothetical protein